MESKLPNLKHKSPRVTCLLFFMAAIAHWPPARAQNSWQKHPAPVLRRSVTFPHWSGLATADATVLQDGDTLKMWYAGSGWLSSTDDCPHLRIGYAWSLDGVSWHEYSGNPVLDISPDPAAFDHDGVETPMVVKDVNAPAAERYKLWYAGRKTRCEPGNDHRFGYAFSHDGITWTKHPGNPVLGPGTDAEWYNTFISSPSVLLEDGTYKMWFTAPDLIVNGQSTDGKGNIGYATSTDGVRWSVHPEPVLIAGDQNNWDAASIAEPSVVKVGDTYHMFYSALNTWAVEHFQVGYATSADGIEWTKSVRNPVLVIGDDSQWDSYWASHPAVIFDEAAGKFRMWYTGRDVADITTFTGYHWDIGYAESSLVAGAKPPADHSRLVSVYPSPADNQLTVRFASPPGQVEVGIYNQWGQLLQNIALAGQPEIVVDLGQLSDGLYLLVVSHKGGQTTERFMIRR